MRTNGYALERMDRDVNVCWGEWGGSPFAGQASELGPEGLVPFRVWRAFHPIRTARLPVARGADPVLWQTSRGESMRVEKCRHVAPRQRAGMTGF